MKGGVTLARKPIVTRDVTISIISIYHLFNRGENNLGSEFVETVEKIGNVSEEKAIKYAHKNYGFDFTAVVEQKHGKVTMDLEDFVKAGTFTESAENGTK